MLLLSIVGALSLRTAVAAPEQGPGGPILVVTSPTSTFGTYYAEILRTEGLNAFAVADISSVNSALLAGYDVVVLAKMTLSGAQVTMLTDWVNSGGNLIAMGPDPQLASLLGLAPAGGTLSNGYLLVNTAQSPGSGIVNQTIQFHGSADRYTLSGATSVATLYGTATAATSNPAVTLRSVGAGHAAAFTYDLAASVIYTRQGNPAWATQERDGFAPVRANDKFFGNAASDPQPDWVDLTKVAIPQADEQQRLLANLILHLNQNKKPLPRFWYFPHGKKAVVVMTGEDHGNGGTAGRFDQFKANSPAGCSVADWECVRATSYIYTSTPLSDAEAAAYTAEGFEVGLHINTSCSNFTAASLEALYAQQLAEWQAKYASISAPVTQRHHCVVWSDWTSAAQVQFNHGMRLDTTYYFWPPSWVGNAPGLFTGSAMPMRFAALDGTLIDNYLAATQLTDESGQAYPFTIDTLLNRAVGAEGYYGAYTVNTHADVATSGEAAAIVASAQARGVPVVSARQMLVWLDGRNASTFDALGWNGSSLSFNLSSASGASGLRAMLPTRFGSATLTSLTRGGNAVAYTAEVIKGIEYAFFAGTGGSYVASYGADTNAPTIIATSPTAGATGVSAGVVVSAIFSEAMSAATINASTVQLRDPGNSLVTASVSYDANSRTARLTPNSPLASGTTYTATVRGGAVDPRAKDPSGNALAADFVWTFSTAGGPAPPTCPCSGWPSTATPANPSSTDTGAVELGVKFRTDVDGFITGIRFYKGASNTGTHVGNLWSSSGALLATAVFSGETASGWQQVDFASPVAITANTVYVASYFAPNGRYAADSFFFASSGVDNGSVHLLRDGVSGGNGVFGYGASSIFPSQSFQATNYWVDVVFMAAPPDTTPPTVTATSPANGTGNVGTGTSVTATFSEAIEAATVSGSTFELRNPSNAVVPATVTYNAGTRTATLTPNSALAVGTTFTATLRGGGADPRIKDVAGNALAANVSWSFTTAADASGCPCSGWPNSATPATPSSPDAAAVELGVKFRTDIDGFATGVRFYKGASNTGTHIGNLWSTSGQLLATAVFGGETASGWQQVNFTSPVAITANTVYVASYFAPNGRYAADNLFFASTGIDNGVVHLLRDGVSGGNGVFAYGTSSSFPSQSYQATNYWVDIVFTASAPPDTTPPTVSTTSPANGAGNVGTGATVTATFSEAINATTVNGSTFELRNPSNAVVSATVTYNAGARTATLTPSSALAVGATFTATLRGGGADPRVKDLAGNALAADVSWSFTTGSDTSGCPCNGWPSSATPTNPSSADSAAVELGVKFRVDLNGYITGVRFYKGAGNTGTHVGSLWSASGQRLTSATFIGETATGWQQVDFPNPVPVTANTVYIASYHAPNGGYAGDNLFFATRGIDNGPVHLLQDGVSGGNGVYAYGAAGSFPTQTYQATNYWVDVVFATVVPPDVTPPTVFSTVPATNATDVAVSSGITATFSEAIDPATVTSATFELRNAANTLVTATLIYDVGSRTARLTPSSLLSAATTYTATLRGGVADPRIKDLAGNALQASYTWSFTTGTPSGACAAPANEVVAENCRGGNPPSEWDVSGAGDSSIQGFATQISVNRGSTVTFKVDTNAAGYRFDIYRLGHYGGMGARRVATALPSATLPQAQPNCLTNASTGLIDCGNWAVSGSWAVPADAVSGIYLARLVRNDNGGASHIVFIVRNDASTSRLLFKTSDTTWQAYNDYGGNSLYTGSPAGRAYKVSYNRPFVTRGTQYGRAWLFGGEYPMVRWLEANGYDVSYFTGVDVERSGALIRNHRVLLSVGHDEYWSAGQRANVEAARDNGVHLAFFSGNEMFWKTRWENSIDGSSTPLRTLVSYKETHVGAKIDPSAQWTGTWRDPRFSPPADGGRPENGLTGTIFMVNCCDASSPGIQVPAAFGNLRFWRNTSVATLPSGAVAILAAGTLGYEWDEDLDNGFRPAGLFRMSSTTVGGVSYLQDYGSSYGSGTATHSLTMYRHGGGALVFGAGTIRWSWGLDGNHDFDSATPNASTTPDVRMQQATVNLFADMNVQPGSLQSGLVAASASTDATAPTSTITSPGASAVVSPNTTITIAGTATDAGGGVVAGIEVSVDGGSTWHPANGRGSWTYMWTTPSSGQATIRSRAADDSGNLEASGAGTTVTIGSGGDTTPPTVTSRSPASGAASVASGTNVTATFSEPMQSATIGSTTFQLLDPSSAPVTATVTYDSATRIATLDPAATLAAGTIYTAVVRGGTTDPRVKDVAGNALAANSTWSFTTAAAPDGTPPTITARSPADGATGVSGSANVTVTFNEAMDPATIAASTIELRDPASAVVAAAVSYNTTTRVATLNPTPTLAAGTVYTVTVRGGAVDPRVKDLAGNPLAATATWSFTTIPDTTAPTVTSIAPASGAISVSRTANVTAVFSEAMNPATIGTSTFELRSSSGALVSAVVTYDAATRRATLNPNVTLAALTTYTATVRGGSVDPRVKDTAGNALAANRVWSFRTQ